MISLKKLAKQRHVFGFFTQQFMYPEKLTYHPKTMEETFQLEAPAYQDIQKYWQLIQAYSMDELEEMYTKTFDFQKDSTLYMTYFKFEDAKERGQMLAELKTMYEMYGLEMPSSELADYLPLMCEFLSIGQWREEKNVIESLQQFMAILEDGTYHLLKSLEKNNSPYFYLVKGLRATLKDCMSKEEICS